MRLGFGLSASGAQPQPIEPLSLVHRAWIGDLHHASRSGHEGHDDVPRAAELGGTFDSIPLSGHGGEPDLHAARVRTDVNDSQDAGGIQRIGPGQELVPIVVTIPIRICWVRSARIEPITAPAATPAMMKP